MPEKSPPPVQDRRKAEEVINKFGNEFPSSEDKQMEIIRIYYSDFSPSSDAQLKTVAKILFYTAYFFAGEFSEKEKSFLEMLIKHKSSSPQRKIELEKILRERFDEKFLPVLKKFYRDEERFFSEEQSSTFQRETEEDPFKEPIEKIHKAYLGRLKWSVKDYPEAVKRGFLWKLKDKKITTKEGEIKIRDLTGEELETFFVYKCRVYGLKIPEDCKD